MLCHTKEDGKVWYMLVTTLYMGIAVCGDCLVQFSWLDLILLSYCSKLVCSTGPLAMLPRPLVNLWSTY